eukprot:Platyproteum_vivax@DN7535_c0_g1_i2.p1
MVGNGAEAGDIMTSFMVWTGIVLGFNGTSQNFEELPQPVLNTCPSCDIKTDLSRVAKHFLNAGFFGRLPINSICVATTLSFTLLMPKPKLPLPKSCPQTHAFPSVVMPIPWTPLQDTSWKRRPLSPSTLLSELTLKMGE